MAIEVRGYVPGAIGEVTALHGRYYAEAWHFDTYFEAKVARDMGAFFHRFTPERDGFWTAVDDGNVVGSVAIDGTDGFGAGAHLRWFIVDPDCRGRGIGRLLMTAAVEFCRGRGYSPIYLWTFEGLDAARRLYEALGFECVEEATGSQWGTRVVEQRFVLNLRD